MDGKRIVITGGAGSAGTAFCQYVKQRNLHPEKIIIMSRDPLKHQALKSKLGEMPCPVNYLIRDVRDKDGLMEAFSHVDIVLHMAAIKHITEGEYDTNEYTKTNVIGTQNVIEASRRNKVQKTLLISTDKATNAVNAYGATKFLAERHMISANVGREDIRFSVCRYGNVVGSNGSVVNVWKEKISQGKKVQLTDERMTRFFYPMNSAIEFILMCLDKMQGGETFIPKINSILLTDLAKALETDYEVTGIRPGEKLHECMVPKETAHLTRDYGDYYLIRPTALFKDIVYPGYGYDVAEGFEYSSDKNKFLTVEEIRKLV